MAEDSPPRSRTTQPDNRAANFGSLPQNGLDLMGAAAMASMPNATTPAPSPLRRRGHRTGSGSSQEATNGHESRRFSDPVQLSRGNRKGGSSGKRDTNRLVRWAAALSGGKTAEAPRTGAHHLRTGSTGGGGPSAGGGGSSSWGGSGGGDPARRRVGAGMSLGNGGLFSTSPLRHRVRPSSRGSKCRSSSSSPEGWTVGNGVGGDRNGPAAGPGPGERLLTLLRLVFKGPLARRLVRRVKMLVALAALTVAGLGALMIGCCLYVTVRPWGRATYRRLLCSQLAAPLVDAASLLLPRTRVRVTGDSDMLDGLCPCVIVSNTLPGNAFLGLDWWAILMVVRAVGAHGFTKVLVSERLTRTPVLGWILRILEFPGLSRNYQTDRERVKQTLASFAKDSVSAGPSGVPYLFLHFPEGDTLSRDTVSSSLEFAKREGRPELMRLLLPHTTALSACLDGLRPAKPVVYDITLAAAGYSGEIPCGKPPSDWDVLRSLISGSAWDGGDSPPCSKPLCACRPNLPDPRYGGGGMGGVYRGGQGRESNLCNEPSCLCRVGGAAAASAAAGAGPVGFAPGGAGGAPPSAHTMGGPRSLSVGASGIFQRSEWGDPDEDEERERQAEDGIWGRKAQDIHVRITRYSLEEVVRNTHWLDCRWAAKERLLSYFARHQSFPSDGRGFPARRTLDTRGDQFEGAAMAFVRLSAVLFVVPLVSLAAIPIVVSMAFAALSFRLVSCMVRVVVMRVLPKRIARKIWWNVDDEEDDDDDDDDEDDLGPGYNGRRSSLTPWWRCPATPLNTPVPGQGGLMSYVTGGGSCAPPEFLAT